MQLSFSGGFVATMFPLGSVVVEYRDSIGTESARFSKDKSSRFSTGYLVTYVGVGIKKPVLGWIVKKSFQR